MTQPTPRPAGPPAPRWLLAAGSLLIVFHLGSVLVNALAAPSGPWPAMEGAEMAMPPQLFALAQEKAALPYLRLLQLTHNFHFRTNRGGQPEAFLELALEDEAGEVMQTVRFPDPKAPAVVRRRQASLTRWLTDDQPVPPGSTEKIPAPGERIPEIAIWEPVEDAPRKLTLARVPENEVRRDRQAFRPTEWSLIVVRAITRNVCREHGAARAEVVRHSREAIPVRVLFEREAPPENEDLQSSYGRLSR
jgi:hypothetical protein